MFILTLSLGNDKMITNIHIAHTNGNMATHFFRKKYIRLKQKNNNKNRSKLRTYYPLLRRIF
jgi:hypothetical protein